MSIYYKIAEEFTETPGPRSAKEGKFSGENFLKMVLLPKFNEAVENNVTLTIDLDGTFGYPPSFLDEAFGGLVEQTKMTKKQIMQHLILKSSRSHYIDVINKIMQTWEELHLK